MKDTVTNYFKTDRAFASGKVLYGTLPGRSTAFNNALNRMTNTPANLSKLHYELGKLAGLPERTVGILLRKPLIANMEVVGEIDLSKGNPDVLKLEKPKFSKGPSGNRERKAFVADKNIKAASGKNVDLDKAIDAWWESNAEHLKKDFGKTTAIETFEASPEPQKKAVKLFDRFTFLSQPDCPEVFKTLVFNLSTTYRAYKEAHPYLFDNLTIEERLEAAKAVATPFKENKAIWAELEHYQTKGECLGKLPEVKAYLRKQDIKAMNGEQLAKLQTNLITNINRNKKALDGLEGEKADTKANLINAQEEELRFVEVELKTR